MKSVKRSGWFLTIAVALCFGVGLRPVMAGASRIPNVVVSISPLHSIVSSVMEGVGTPELLMSGGESPHSFSLKPSHLRMLGNADAVFWIGPDMEAFLVHALEVSVPKGASVVAMEDAKRVVMLKVREGNQWELEEDEDHADHGHGQHEGMNPHIWLDPENAIAMAQTVAFTLAGSDPDHAEIYHSNSEKFAVRIRELVRRIDAELAPVRSKPYIVFHDAYQYFETAFGLSPVGSVTVSPDRAPGARRVTEIRERITSGGAVCIFTEPQFSPAILSRLVEGTAVGTGELDPLGSGIEPGPDMYATLLKRLTGSLATCLSGG